MNIIQICFQNTKTNLLFVRLTESFVIFILLTRSYKFFLGIQKIMDFKYILQNVRTC